MKKQPMAEAAEQLLAGTGWLPRLLRTEPPVWLDGQQANAEPVAEAPEAAEPEAAEAAESEADPDAEDGADVDGEAFNVAAE